MIWNTLIHNTVLVAAVMGWFIAQVLKTIIHLLMNKKLDLERLTGSGGMPSSHSATVCAMCASAFMEYGAGSFEFAIAFILAAIVMYDARGVRRETGIQAQILNEMIEFFNQMGEKVSREKKLKELVGHTPLQVLIGGILGIIIGVVVGFWL